jgi:hypothetical protein
MWLSHFLLYFICLQFRRRLRPTSPETTIIIIVIITTAATIISRSPAGENDEIKATFH